VENRLALAALVLLAAIPLSPRAAAVWTAGASEKILPGTPPRAAASASLSAARNELEAFQVVVTGPASRVSARASDLAGPGHIGGVKLYREALIALAQPSSVDGSTGRFPDALVPDVDDVVGERRNAFPFDVPAGESRAIWVEVLVPPGAPAGDYAGAVTIDSDSGETAVPVSLTVWDFDLPSTASLRSWFGLAYGTLPATHHVSGDGFAALRARYSQLALDHRISLGRFDDGNASLDHFDRFYGPLLDGTAPTRLSGARQTSVSYLGDLRSTTTMSQWAAHFRARGWFDRLFQYTCDEPPVTCAWSDIPARAAAAKAADPALRTLVTTTIQDANANGVASSIDLITPVINDLDDKPGKPHAGPQWLAYVPFRASGAEKEVWTYQSCVSHGCGGSSPYYTGWPSYMIDASAVRARAEEWLSFQYGVQGELYWETTNAFTGDAWSSQWAFSGNGDGTLFYPGTPDRIGGTTHIPVASIRLKMIREGMEDYEYLKKVSDLGDPDFARQTASSLFPNAYTTDVKPEDLMAARAKLARRILELSHAQQPGSGGAAGAIEPLASCDTTRGSGALTSGVAFLGTLRRRPYLNH
jgi:hypothetical protein